MIKKRLLTIFSFLMLGNSLAQETPSVLEYYYVSKWDYKNADVFFNIGHKLLFAQDCINTLPKNVTTGLVNFENFYFENEKFLFTVEFKDTMIVTNVFHFKTNDVKLLEKFGDINFKKKCVEIKKNWTYVYVLNNVQTVITCNRKNITIVKTLFPKVD